MKLEDIDGYDPSEEQFASSLAGRETETQEQEYCSGSLASAREHAIAERPEAGPPTGRIGCAVLNSRSALDECWREEVSSRLQNYKARRRRSLGDESLSFNFESTTANHVFLRPDPSSEPAPAGAEMVATYYPSPLATAPAVSTTDEFTLHMAEYLSHPEPEPEQLEMPEPILPPAVKAPSLPETAKLILFPKPPMMEEAPADQLAEPVFESPRIVEAPDATETVTVPLADITLQPDAMDDACVPFMEPLLDLAVPVAPISKRVTAEIVDGAVVVVATAIFAGIAMRMGAAPIVGDKRSFAAAILAVPALLWWMYKYIFLVHSGATPGMRGVRLRLLNFEGQNAWKPVRRHRALAMLISVFPLGLGLLWAFVDTETLCWHDRISKTYVVRK